MELKTLSPPVNTGAINKIKTFSENENNGKTENGSRARNDEKPRERLEGNSNSSKDEQKAHTNLEIIVSDVDNEDDSGEDEKKKEPRISCCYGIMVFVGLAISLFGLTLLVIYAGFWSNYANQGK
jgi:hypothetical protein